MPHSSAVADAWPFVARDEELALLVAEANRGEREADAATGVVVVGVAGVGKTRLLDEFRNMHATHATRMIATRAAALKPFGAFAPVVAGMSPRDVDDLAAWYDVVAAALRSTTKGNSRPVLVVDDAHLLDDLSAALVLHLAMSNVATVVVGVRHGEACPEPIGALWRDQILRRVDLQPFSRTDAEALITEALGGPVGGRERHLLAEHCGGNALFLREVLTAARSSGSLTFVDGVWRWNGEIPHTPRLVDAIEARMADLDAPARRAVATVALGEPLELAIAEALVRIDS